MSFQELVNRHHDNYLVMFDTLSDSVARKDQEIREVTEALAARKACLDKHENDLAAREAALINREAAIGQIRELASTRLVAKKVLEERLAEAEADAAAARKELSDLKSKLRNPNNPAFAAVLQEALKA